MSLSRFAAIAVAAVVVLAGAGHAPAVADEKGHVQKKAEVVASQTSLAQAIAAAEQQTGGRAATIKLRQRDGAYLYRVKTVTNDRAVAVIVDAKTGKVVRTREPGVMTRFVRFFDNDDKEDFDRLAASPTTLVAAIAAAEQQTGGKAIEAELEDEHDTARFEIEVAKDNAVQKVVVDPTTGKVLDVGKAKRRGHDR